VNLLIAADGNRVWAYYTVMTDPRRYYADQAPNHPITAAAFTPQAQALTLQMGNVLLLLAGIATICCWTRHPEIAFWYLVVVGFADFGHIYASYCADPSYFWDITQWNGMMAGNVGCSAFLNVNRWLTVLGVFGTIRADADAGHAKKSA